MEQNNYQSAFEHGLQSQPVRELEQTPFVVLHKDSKIESLEHLLPQPLMKNRTLRFEEPASFARYVQDHMEPSTALFASQSEGRFLAILDYHESKATPEAKGASPARWCRHQAIYACPHSYIWKLWNGSNNKFMPQRDFAEFIEANSPQISAPPAADFLEMAQTLTAKTTVAFTGSTRLDNGRDEIRFESTTESKAGEKGNLQVPAKFTIRLPVYQGGENWDIDARLRHRITDGKKLELKYELVNPQLTLRSAWDRLVETVNKATKLTAYIGQP